MLLHEARDALVEVGRRLWQRGHVAANDGNLSVRVGAGRLLATPTGVSKGFMSPETMVLVDMEGRPLQGSGRPSSELLMHLEIYRLRPDVQAVVHAHPPMATAFSVAGVALDRCVLPEAVLTMGAIPLVPYATPGSRELPAAMRAWIDRCDAVLLANHGAVTWATSLDEAYFRMETLEHTATITHHAMSLGTVNLLTEVDVAALRQIRERARIPGRVLPCEAAGTCAAFPDATVPGGRTDPDLDELVERVSRAVIDVLRGRVG